MWMWRVMGLCSSPTTQSSSTLALCRSFAAWKLSLALSVHITLHLPLYLYLSQIYARTVTGKCVSVWCAGMWSEHRSMDVHRHRSRNGIRFTHHASQFWLQGFILFELEQIHKLHFVIHSSRQNGTPSHVSAHFASKLARGRLLLLIVVGIISFLLK